MFLEWTWIVRSRCDRVSSAGGTAARAARRVLIVVVTIWLIIHRLLDLKLAMPLRSLLVRCLVWRLIHYRVK